MSADKRSVHTDALATLGTIIDDTQKRDAIHLAVEPCIAGEELRPGQDIGIFKGRAMSRALKMLGIVDPFLKENVKEGEMFWLIVYPRQITSLRHVWEHPDFHDIAEEKNSEESKAASEKWLREFCRTADCPSYEDVIREIVSGNAFDRDYLYFSGMDAHGSIPDEFWTHVEVVTGMEMQERPKYFTCSC